jgi:hypothetical protein
MKRPLGIFKIEGDELTVCLNFNKNRRPTKFATDKVAADDDDIQMLVRLKTKNE